MARIGSKSKPSSKPSTFFSSQSPSESSSKSITETINGSHEFKITGYSLAKGLGIGQFIASDTFTVGGYYFRILFYPDGKHIEDNANYVSLFIALAGAGFRVRALFEVTLFDQSGKERHWVDNHFGRALQDGPYMLNSCDGVLNSCGSMWGYKHFYKKTALETSDYLKDDCLSVKCSVWVVTSHTEELKSYTIPVPPSDITQHFGQLLESGEGTDISFEVDGEIFAAHKPVLAARSPVFRAQLFGPLRDMQCIKVEEIQPAVFKALLHFIYCDCLPKMQVKRVASTDMAQHLLVGAEKYELKRLKLLCEAWLCEDLSTKTVGTILASAEKYNCIHLKDFCLKFIALPENLVAVMQTEGFEDLKIICPSISTQILEYVAKMGVNSAGSDVNGRRVKPRLA